MSDNWLSGLKAGDVVGVERLHQPTVPVTVERVTATQIIVTRGNATATGRFAERYRKADGYIVGGDGYTHSHLAQWTDAEAETYRNVVRKSRLARKVQSLAEELAHAVSPERLNEIEAGIGSIKEV